jgi:hypothetical protein
MIINPRTAPVKRRSGHPARLARERGYGLRKVSAVRVRTMLGLHHSSGDVVLGLFVVPRRFRRLVLGSSGQSGDVVLVMDLLTSPMSDPLRTASALLAVHREMSRAGTTLVFTVASGHDRLENFYRTLGARRVARSRISGNSKWIIRDGRENPASLVGSG